ncbi:MAG: glycoside hydrolase family 38 C-terminal domain-containing protein, partial [Eubacteriales bacterium]
EKVLFNHFHDILPGSGITETREYASALHQEAAGAAGARRKAAFYQLTEKMDTHSLMEPADTAFSRGEGGGAGFGGDLGGCGHTAGKKRIFHLFNSCAWERTEVTEFVVWDYEGDKNRLAVQTPDGQWLDTQITEQGGYWGHSFTRLLAKVTVPASGWAAVLVSEKPVTPGFGFANDMRVQNPETFVLENSKLRAVFHPATASLCSLYNKETGRELLPAGQEGRFELATEAVWKEVTGWNGGMSAWFTGRQKQVIPLTTAEMRPLSSGSNRKRLEISTEFGASRLRIEVFLDENSPILRYKVSCDWKEFGSQEKGVPCLQFTMPAACAAEKYLYDVPFSFLSRKGREMDLPANRFVMASDETDALLLTAQSKYGYRTANGRMTVTLIRGAYEPDPTPEIGHHETEFALITAPAGKKNRDYAQLVQAYEHPILTIAGRPHPGTLPVSEKFVQLVSGNVLLSSVKVSEDGKALILKLYETEGKAGEYTIDCGFVPASASQADQLERPVEKNLCLDGQKISALIAPCQLQILRLEF